MAKDLTKMPVEKLIARALNALQEIQRRMDHQAQPAPVQPMSRVVDAAAESGILTPGMTQSDIEAARARTMQERLKSNRVPQPDPAYLALYNQTNARPAPENEVGFAAKNGMPIPTSNGQG